MLRLCTLVAVVVLLVVCEASYARDTFHQRSDEITEAISVFDNFGTLAAIQLPLERVQKPLSMSRFKPQQQSNQNNIPRAGEYAIPLATLDKTAWAIPINLGLGTALKVTVDTGSSDLYVSGPLCAGAGCTTGNPYVEGSNYKGLSCPSAACRSTNVCYTGGLCNVTTCYGQGGLSGVIGSDTIGITGIPNTATATFGNLYDVTGANCPSSNKGSVFDSLYTGIIGVAFANNAATLVNQTALDALIQANGLTNAFSLCVEQVNAFMSVGSDYSCNSDFAYTPITQDAYYSVDVTDMGIGSTSFGLVSSQLNLKVNGVGTIVDSGTTLFIINNEVSTALQNALNNMCAANVDLVGYCGQSTQSIFQGYCWSMSSDKLDLYPSIYINLSGGASITLAPSDWLISLGCPSGSYTSGIAWFTNFNTIIGDIAMATKHVVFDKASNRVGFGPVSSCNILAATCQASGT